MGSFYQRDDIAHAQNAVGHTSRVEVVYGFEFFACSYKFNRFVDYGADRECRTATGVAVQFGENYSVEIETIVKFFGCVDRILSGHGVNDEQGLGRVDFFLDSLDFVHHLLVDSQTSCRVDDNQIEMVFFGIFYGIGGNAHRVFAIFLGINRYIDLFT